MAGTKPSGHAAELLTMQSASNPPQFFAGQDLFNS
jgi:hypothetical protein